MKRKLIVTLTTVRGSRQYTLGQLSKYLLLAFLLLSALSFFVSNALLVRTSEDLALLEEDHQQLSADYELMLGTQQLYQVELDQLSATLSLLQSEKSDLEEENLRIGALNESLDASLGSLQAMLGLPLAEDMTPEEAEQLQVLAHQRLYFLHSIPNGVPIQAQRITDRFGPRTHPVFKKRVMHHGIDFKAPPGTPVYATADGVVEFSGFHKASGYGRLVILQHSLGFKTYYGHLQTLKVQGRQFVHKGQLIGLSGNSGISTGPHLHYEVRHLHAAVDPEPFIAWDLNSFDSLFTEVKDVKWASLKGMYPLNQSVLP